MVKRKNIAKRSSDLHRTIYVKTSGKNSDLVIKRIVLVAIGLTMAAVVIALISAFVFDDEKMVKSKMEGLAKEYYESYIYINLIDDTMSDEKVAELMDNYGLKGFAPVNLRQLLLHDRQNHIDDIEYIRRYCDENRTTVRFFPEAPFEKEDYRVEFRYDCEF